jgi:alpha-tubulin suppressor-like RCC1 family protein
VLGYNGEGQLGDGTFSSSSTPVPSNYGGATAIAAGETHTCALYAGGTVTCWGDNTFGELGNGTTLTSPDPVTVSGLTGVTAIAVGEEYSCALITGGTVECWGNNAYGHLGDGTTMSSTTPVVVSGLSGGDGHCLRQWAQLRPSQRRGGRLLGE